MKITRSALKSLIKEEMNRINEVNPGDMPLVDDPSLQGSTTVTGAEPPKYMFDGMEKSDVEGWLSSMDNHARRSLVSASWNEKEFTLGGFKDYEQHARRLTQYHNAEASRSNARTLNRGVYPIISFEVKFDATADPTDGAGYALATLTNANTETNMTDGSAKVARYVEEEILAPFNSQNGGKGGKMTQGGTSLLEEDLSWTWYYRT